MKRIEVSGLGVYVEVYRRDGKYTDIEALKEAVKALQREIIKYEIKAD